MSRSLLWLARILVAAGLALVLMAPDVNGPVLAAIWLIVLVAYRWMASAPASGPGRAAVDAAFLALALVAAFEGGWTFIPAGLCYLGADLVGSGRGAGRQDLAVG